EVRGGTQEHDIDPGVDDLLVGVKADEAPRHWHVELTGDVFLGECGQTVAEPVGEGVTHRDEFDGPVGAEGLHGGAAAASAAADEADAQHVAAARVDVAGAGENRGAGDGGGRRGQKLAARTVVRRVLLGHEIVSWRGEPLGTRARGIIVAYSSVTVHS